MKFLLNTTILDLGPDCDPFATPGFPLSREQYQGITINQLAEMLAGEFAADAQVIARHPMRIKRLCWMLQEKAQVNALKLSWQGGTKAQFGQVPELAFAGLIAMAERGQLTPAAVEEAVWSKLQR
jgi:hypothetical protein